MEQLTPILSPLQQTILRYLLQCGGQAKASQLIGGLRIPRSREELDKIIDPLVQYELVEVERGLVRVTDGLDRRARKIIQGKVGPIVDEFHVTVRSRR